MTAHDVSEMNHARLHADKLCAVLDRAYGTASTQEVHFLIQGCGFHPRPHRL